MRRFSREKDARPALVLHIELKPAPMDFSRYPFSLPCIKGLDRLAFHPEVTVLVGENGSGKSSLLEGVAVAVGYNPEGGSRNFCFETRSSHSDLWRHLRIARGRPIPHGYFLRAESFFNVATRIEELDREPALAPPIIDSYGSQSLHEQSHGESFMALLHHRFAPGGFYVLDEPEAALSVRNQMSALARMHELAQKGAQFLMATHSPILMAYPGAYIYKLGQTGIRRVTYEDIEHVKTMREFMRDPRACLGSVLGMQPVDDD